MDTVARKWHVLVLLLCTPFLHCVELCAQPYIDPANEFVVADTAATELAAIYTPGKLTLTKSSPSALSPAHRPETIE